MADNDVIARSSANSLVIMQTQSGLNFHGTTLWKRMTLVPTTKKTLIVNNSEQTLCENMKKGEFN